MCFGVAGKRKKKETKAKLAWHICDMWNLSIYFECNLFHSISFSLGRSFDRSIQAYKPIHLYPCVSSSREYTFRLRHWHCRHFKSIPNNVVYRSVDHSFNLFCIGLKLYHTHKLKKMWRKKLTATRFRVMHTHTHTSRTYFKSEYNNYFMPMTNKRNKNHSMMIEI